MPRLRDLGLTPGLLPPGHHNAITDVTGVRVGHTTLVEGTGPLVPGEGPIRTGVTAILSHGGNLFEQKVVAAAHTLNGYGKAAGFEQVRELGAIETPILLTNTLNVGSTTDAVISHMLRDNPDIGIRTSTVNPVVGECNDGFLNDIQGRHVRAEHVWQSIQNAANGPVAEGNVGAGTGTGCFGFKGGIGTASRLVADFTVGVLVQTNFGSRTHLMMLGVPVGRSFADRLLPTSAPGPGSVMIVLATDAPLTSRQLGRLAKRAAFGLARTGSISSNGSGDFVVVFSTANPRAHRPTGVVEQVARIPDEAHGIIDRLFLAVVESVEEAVLNALLMANTMTGRDGNTLYALPAEEVREMLVGSR
ncbi:MAG: P1 family peptidase [Anaerolineae bacterium]|nr:P1 family peptidase [Anaerolineae bacterium]